MTRRKTEDIVRPALAIALAALTLVTPFVVTAPAASAAPRPSLLIEDPVPHQIVQRSSRGTATLRITGTLRGSHSPVQARWDGGRWFTIDAHPDGGRFAGKICGLPAGQGTLQLRLSRDHAVRDAHDWVGIGDIFVIAGQSNACGRAPTMQTWSSRVFSAGMLANDGRWKVLKDPVDNPARQIDTVSRDHPVRASGSVWPLLATRIMAGAKVPVAFIPVPYSGSAIEDWQRRDDRPRDPDTLYGNMLRRIELAGGAVRAVLFWQGEREAGSGYVLRHLYEPLLKEVATDVQDDIGAPLIVCQIGEVRWNQDTPPPAPALDSIRAAQLTSWDWAGLVAPGPALYDILLYQPGDDRVHYRTPEQLNLVARRWWCAVEAACYGVGDGRGARLTAAAYDAGGPAVVLDFSDDSLPLALPDGGDPAAAFTVRDEAGVITVSDVSLTGPGELRLGLSRAASGGVSVSLGEGHTGAVNPVPHDTGRWQLPVELFLEHPVVIP